MRASRHSDESFGSPLMPNCTMKPVTTRKNRVVVEEAVLDQIVETVGAVRGPVAMHLDHERTLAGVELHLVGRRRLFVQGGGIGEVLRGGGCGQYRCGQYQREQASDNVDHVISRIKRFQTLANLRFSRAATSAGTKAETSPPMAAIWRTKVAVIGRTAGDGGRKTVCTPGAMAAFIPAICIS